MRSKKLAVRFGLLTVLLVSLCLTSTSKAWIIYPRYYPKVTTPKFSWEPYWRGGIKIKLSCDTPGATIRYTWASGKGAAAPIPTTSSRLYWCPLLVTREGQLKARGFKPGYYASNILVLTFTYR